MQFFVPRNEVIANIITALQGVSSVALVKPYEGEFFRFYLKSQVQGETFPAEVNLTTPFALVSSRSRPVIGRRNRVLEMKHEISLLVGIENSHNFGDDAVSGVFQVLQDCAAMLVGQKFHTHASELMLDNDGIFLAKTDLFIVYEQQLSQLERATQ
jgi:hypothetical protein